MHNILNILSGGEGVLIKRNKKGFYVNMPYGKNIFIPFSETLTDIIFDESLESDKNEHDPSSLPTA